MNRPESLLPCHRTNLPKALLRKCKAACGKYNKQYRDTDGKDEGCSSSSL